jgi:protein TonB
VYPSKARKQNIEGWVDVNFLITSDGSVIEPRVASQTLGAPFHRAAVDAVTQWKFSSAPKGMKSHRPMHVRLEFRLTQ